MTSNNDFLGIIPRGLHTRALYSFHFMFMLLLNDARVFHNAFPYPLVTGFTFVRLGHVAQWAVRSLASKLMPYPCIRYHRFRGPLGMLRHPFLLGHLLYNSKKSNFLIMESSSETNGKLLFVLTKQICPIGCCHSL